MTEEYIMGSYTVFLDPESVKVPNKPVEVVFPLQWMHNFLELDVIGSQNNLKIILDFLVTWEYSDYEVNWVKYGINNPNDTNAEHATPDEQIGWIMALSNTLSQQTGVDEKKVRKILVENVPFDVLTGWDMNIGEQNWDRLIFLLLSYPTMSEVRVQIAESNILTVMLSGAVDSDKSLRVVSLKGWEDWREVKETEPNWKTYEDVTNFLGPIVVYPKGMYKWEQRVDTFYAAINKKVIK